MGASKEKTSRAKLNPELSDSLYLLLWLFLSSSVPLRLKIPIIILTPQHRIGYALLYPVHHCGRPQLMHGGVVRMLEAEIFLISMPLFFLPLALTLLHPA